MEKKITQQSSKKPQIGQDPTVNFLPAAAFHMLCLADDLTLHVTCGDIAHSCRRRTVSGLRALSAYSSQIGVRTEADLLTRH